MLRNFIGVRCGVPQTTNPLLFIIYTNYLDYGIRNNISKFLDNTQIERQISSGQEGMILLERKLNRINEWAVKWKMDINIKCSAIHVGRHNTRNRYTLNGADIGKSNTEKDLGDIGESRPGAQRAVY